ncbi:uncharacterized protein [Apostichopus japonicus]|uniref:uncharacterized protein isoform X4 n=1 Tax=Stichopus japonicus TaxID=307972 RepID=UPI003AB22284
MDHSLTLCFLFFVWISHVTAQGVSIEGCPILPVRLGVPNQDDSIIGTWTEPTANAERIFRSHIPGQAMLPVGFHDIIYEFQNTATGEEGSCTFLFIVFWFGDDQPPQIQNCPGEIVRTLSAGASTVTVSWNVPTAIDNAGPFMSTSSHVPPFDFPVGVHTVTYTFEDTRGLTSICEFNVMVTGIDMELPVINCPENQLENAVAGAATWFVSWPAVTATDDSLQTPQLISSSPSSLQGLTGGTFPVGRVTTVRYDYADGSGNVASCMFDVTVNAFVDMDPPMIRCSDSDVRRVASGSDAVVVWTVPTIEFDASLPVQIVSNFESGETFPIGTELVEYTFTDAVGNVAVCSFNVIVEDITPPVFQNCPQVDIMDTLTVTETSKRIEWQTIVAVDNSNGMTFITGTHESGQFFFEGTTEVTLTARDESNNMATCQFRVVLTRDTENEPPVVMNCPMPITEIAPGDQSGSTVSWEEPRAQDDDGIPTRGRTHVPPELFPIGITDVEYTFTDSGGLVSSCRFTVTILDQTPPQIFGCPQVPITATLSPDGSETPVSFTPPTATDNSLGIVTTSSTHNPGETFPLGTTPVTYQFRDESGNIDQCEFAVIVSDLPDLIRPEIFNCPDDITQQASGTGQELVRWPPITATDDSGVPPMLVLGPPNFQDFFTPGMSEGVTYLFQDAAGNANTCTFRVTVVNQPTLPLVVNCTGRDIVETAMFGFSSVFVTLPTCSATDDSGQAIFVSQTPPSGFFELGLTTVTNIFADTDGNQGFGTFTVTVNPEADNEPPVVDCSGRTVRRNAPAGASGVQVVLPSCTATDNSGTVFEVSQSPPSGSFFSIGTTQVANTFVDPSGNQGVGTFEVIVSVSSPPVVDCSGLDIVLTVSLVATGSSATYAPCPATDDSGLPTFSSQSPPSGSFFRLGTTVVETCYVDPDGNRGCDSFTVTVNAADNEPPIVDCSGRTVRRNAPAGASGVQVVLPSCTATDNSGTVFEESQSPTSGSFFPIGTTGVTNTFVDPSGNQGVGTFEVIISADNEPPVVDCSGRTVRRNAPPGASGVSVVLPSCTATDNSGTANEVSQSPTSGSFFLIGTTPVTNTFVDPSGNRGMGTFEVIISGDNEPPVVDCSGITVNRNAPPGSSGVQVVLPSCTAIDNSGTVFEVSQSPPSGSFFPIGTTRVTNTFVDPSGNRGMGTFEVIISVDNEPPVVNCDGLSFSRTVPAGTQSLVVPNLPDCTATDNSGTVLPLPQNPPPGTPFSVGPTMVGNTFEDPSGNRATGFYTVTIIEDRPRLQIICPTNAVAKCQTNSNAIIGLWSDPDCTGGVQPITTSCNPSSGSDISSGQTFAICTCVDNAGETETCFFNLPAAENIPPTVDCSGLDITRMAPFGASGVTVLLPSCRASDNSGTVLPMNQSPRSGSFFTIGSTTVINTFEDACGNTATDTFIVTVNPEIRLVDITCPSDGTGGNEVAPGTFIATWSNPICTGSSGTLSTSCDPASGTPVGLGTTVVRCSCTDVRGQRDECTFAIFNADVMPPSVDCSGRDEVVMVLPPARGATVMLPSCEVSDNSGSSSLVRQSPTSGSFFPLGTTPVTNEYADDSGNRGSDVFTVTVVVVDIEGPDVTCADILRTVPFGQSGAIVQLNTCTAVDNSGRPPSLLSYQPTSGSFFPIGSTEVRVIFLDDAGNSGTDTFNVIVQGLDGIDPSVNCAGRDINADTTGSCAVVSFAPCTATDNSGVPPVLDFQSHQSGDCFPVGTTAVVFTFRDGAGNTGSGSFDIVVTRDTAPVLLRCPDDITDQVLITMGGGIVQYDAPTAFDESGSVQIINDVIFVPGSFFPLGTTPVTYVFSDPSGNTVECSFSVTLVGVNPCSSRICQNGGVCQAMSLTDAACVCSGCFTGSTCQISTGACNLNSCSNGGVCIPFADSCTASSCDCPRCFSGLSCQTRVSACRNHECLNGASCIPDPVECDQYTCECLNCFRGEFCAIAIPDPCSSTPCLNGGQCIRRSDSCYGFFCACQTGFSGERCESSVNILENPCNNFPCENDGSCVSSGSVYKCLCRDGYTGINCRQQTGSNSFFDQCVSSPCANGGSCFNSYSTSSGSLTYTPQYTCVCPNSYTGERCTVLTSLVPQLNRCQSSNICQNGGTCLNSYCSFDDRVDFFCDCPIGFIGEVCTIPYGNPCSTIPCSNGGTCVPFNQYFVCECRPGFSGSTCGLLGDVIPPTISGCPQQTIVVQASPGASSAQVSWPTPQVSDNSGGPVQLVSVNAVSGAFYGVGTNQEVEYVYEDVSGNRNSCSFFIIVTQGTSTGCQLNPCLNGGTCRQVAGVDSCICPPGFTGQTCSQRTNPCSSTPCQNGGTCVQISVTGFLCQCPNQFEGDRCQTNTLVTCASQPCENGGTCVQIAASSILCLCTGQFEGDRCQNGNPCNSFPCLNGGTCIPSANAPDFFCICRANLQGPLCQQALLDTTAPNIAGCPGNITVTSFTSNYEQVTWQVPTATDASPPVTRTETHFPGVFISRGQTINVIYHFTDAFTNTAVCSFFIVAPV